MSIENALAENTAALIRNAMINERLLAVLERGAAPAVEPSDKPAKARKPKPEASAEPQAEPALEAAAEPVAEPVALTYDGDVRPAILALAKADANDTTRALEILNRFGVSNGSNLKPEQFAGVVAAIREALGQ